MRYDVAEHIRHFFPEITMPAGSRLENEVLRSRYIMMGFDVRYKVKTCRSISRIVVIRSKT